MPRHGAVAVALVVAWSGGVEGWTPQPPWVEPTNICMDSFVGTLRSTLSTHRVGCAASIPKDADKQGAEPTASECVNSCFGYFFHGQEASLGTLNVTALWDEQHSLCYCHETPVHVNDTSKTCTGVVVYQLPTGCMFESREACADAPADGCILTLDNCCIDASGDVWPGFHNLVPWWAWGVGAVVLLSCSLLGLVRRTMTRYGGRYDPLPQQPEEFDEETLDRLKEEYAQLLKQLVEDDKRFQHAKQAAAHAPQDDLPDDDGGEVLHPPSSTSDAADAEGLVGTGASLDLDHDYGQGGTCPICLDDLDPVLCVRLRCGHRLRLACMQQYVLHSISRGKIPACPICRAKVLTLPAQEQEETA
eukprot:TRINITY_DN819_c0_g1_i2.p1 TRINITY_DN819_c0_g1~~TRINITY_DN819_c0_g1_i2.p1  ORF type:complete len:361 (+),score=106.75 TRINITY_DN819_c0_g1_i2:82-1164(+)